MWPLGEAPLEAFVEEFADFMISKIVGSYDMNSISYDPTILEIIEG